MTPQKPTDNLIGYRNQSALRVSPTQERREPRQSKVAGRTPQESAPTERLEAAGRMAAWLAHHINNPLGAISGNAQLLARRLQRDISDPEALRAYMKHLEVIQSQIERCARITGEALSLAKPGDPDLRRIDAAAMIQEAIELVRFARPESCISFTMDDQANLPEIRADREWLIRVIFELLSNAVEASHDEPVNIKAGAVSARNRSAKIRIAISDSGPGIAEDVLPRVFDPFFSTREKARGLGLTLSLEMMRKMGGTLEVEQSETTGCTVAITIPVWGQQRL